jgi:hypothetical protein
MARIFLLAFRYRVGNIHYPAIVNPQRYCRRAIPQACRIFRKPGNDSG